MSDDEEEFSEESYAEFGKRLMQDVNAFNPSDGRFVSTPFLLAPIAMLNGLEVVSPNTQPLYNIRNEYMGWRVGGKTYLVKQVRKREKILKVKYWTTIAVVALAGYAIAVDGTPLMVTSYVAAMLGMVYLSITLDERRYLWRPRR